MRNVFGTIVAFALPPRCAGCGVIVHDDRLLCLSCWGTIDFLTGPGCERCGTRLDPSHAVCAPCLQKPPDHDGAIAAVAYGDIARKIALKLKHGRHIGLARLIARLIVSRLPAERGVLVPVPLHRWRIFRRGFNQSALVAQHLADATDLPLKIDALRRDRGTPLLRGRNARERQKLVQGAFSVADGARQGLIGNTVFLVDDVYTSGATTNACARVLKRAGASRVIVLCWARVLRDHGED